LLANIASGYVLHRAQAGSLNVRGAFLHVVSDAIGSAGAILASLAILFFDWRVADSLISVLVAVLILSSSWRLIREAVNILLEGAPAHIDLKSLSEGIVSAAGVSSVHDLHVWTLTSGVVAMSCHVVAAPGRAGSDVLARVSGIAQGSFGIDHATIQVEYEEEGGPRAGACVCQFGAR
jgi:cobalt-zinc-cadmium efflux system protein